MADDQQSMSQPNIILVLIDDLGWSDVGCYGSSFYETPHIDRLAGDGVRFTDAYAAAPVCSPTRASILTGKYPATLGVTDWIDWGVGVHPARGRLIDAPYVDHLPFADDTLPRALKTVDYQTWHVGKWHLGSPPYTPANHGFDVTVAGCPAGLPGKGYWSPWGIENLEDRVDGEYLTDRLTDEAIELIRRSGGRPFFLNLWHYTVHIPLHAKPDVIRKYESKARALGLDKQPTFADGARFPVRHKQNQHIKRRLIQSDPVYAAMIEHLDENIGRLLAAVDEAGLTDQTTIIFASDNGGLATAEGSPTSNAPLREGKGLLYEGGTRVPLVVKGPGVHRPGGVCTAPVTSPDLYATILEMAGAPRSLAESYDGRSLLPFLQGSDSPDREPLFWHYPHYGNQGGTPASAVRRGDFKLIEFLEDHSVELYNLADDIGESRNLATADARVAEELQQLLADWRARLGARIPQPDPDHKQP